MKIYKRQHIQPSTVGTPRRARHQMTPGQNCPGEVKVWRAESLAELDEIIRKQGTHERDHLPIVGGVT